MSTSPAENPVPGVVTFTARGNAALDQLADALAAECDGSPASIADLLERVLEADVEDLAESLSETTQPPADGPASRSKRSVLPPRALTRPSDVDSERTHQEPPAPRRHAASTSAADPTQRAYTSLHKAAV